MTVTGRKGSVARAVVCLSGCLLGCSSRILSHKDSDAIQSNKEFDRAVQIVDLPSNEAWVPGEFVSMNPRAGAYRPVDPPPGVPPAPTPPKGPPRGKKGHGKIARAAPAPVPGATAPPEARPTHRPPDIEDDEGFLGRRPVVDPFRVGEKTTLQLSYFGVVAGDLEMGVGTFASVNGRKAYRFTAKANSRSLFSMIYAVDDWAETFVDHETLVPSTYALHVKESKQLREQRMYFDWRAMQAHFWDKRVAKDSGVEEKKLDWEALAFSQTIFSGPFYLRTFALSPGKKLAFRVANEGKNYVFTGEVLRRETIATPAGTFQTVVVRPQIQLGGVFQPVGEILFWLTDDDRKFFVRIESKIKIGTIVGVAKSIERGAP